MKIVEIAASWNRVKVSLRHHSLGKASAEAVWPRRPEIHRNPWNLMKSQIINENQWNSSQLGSRKGFFRALIPFAKRRQRPFDIGDLKPIEIHRNSLNLMKSSEIHANRWNNSQLGSSKGFFQAIIPLAKRRQRPFDIGDLKSIEIHEILWIPRKSMEIVVAASYARVKVSLGPSLRLQSVGRGRLTSETWNP